MADPNSPFYPEDDYWPADETTGEPTFELWLEFEHFVSDVPDQLGQGWFNMGIYLSNGKKYYLTVWTFKYLDIARSEDRETGENLNGSYLLPPDLIVDQPDRKLLEEIVADMIKHRCLKQEWLGSEITDDTSQK